MSSPIRSNQQPYLTLSLRVTFVFTPSTEDAKLGSHESLKFKKYVFVLCCTHAMRPLTDKAD